jgi:hypothetical protein
MCDAGVGEQDQPQTGIAELLEDWHDGRVELEDVSSGMANEGGVELLAGAAGEFCAEFSFRTFSAFHEPLPLICEEKSPCFRLRKPGHGGEIAAHEVM